MILLDMDAFERLLCTYISTYGSDAGISNVILPFTEKINLLQNEHKFHHAQEQMVFSILRKKIISAILLLSDSCTYAKTILMFLPEGDHNEIELLLMQYFTKQKGLRVIYLGTNVPVKDVFQIASYKKPDYIFTMLNKERSHLKQEKYIEKLSLLFNEYKIIITSKPLQRYEEQVPENILLNSSATEAMRFFF